MSVTDCSWLSISQTSVELYLVTSSQNGQKAIVMVIASKRTGVQISTQNSSTIHVFLNEQTCQCISLTRSVTKMEESMRNAPEAKTWVHGRMKEFLYDRFAIRNMLTFPTAWNKTGIFTPYVINNQQCVLSPQMQNGVEYDSLFSGLWQKPRFHSGIYRKCVQT